MKVSLNWLKDYVATGMPAEKLAHKLTMAGLEVEKMFSVNGDTVFEMEITPNRPDCLNMMGISREVAAILNKTLKFPKIKKLRFPKKKYALEILDKKGCPRYIGTFIENVRVARTPVWIKKRISPLGIRSVNNVVDITNFCLMETGQPLHAFDADKLAGGKIIVRRARKGEVIVTIDNEVRELDPSILVIADAKRPVAIAGVMGGKETEVTHKTKNILLESAYFDPILIRRASRKLGLASDSSYRFERGVDYDTVEAGANRAISLILDCAQGTMTKRLDVISSRQKVTKSQIALSSEQINTFLGASLTSAQCANILKKLDFKVTKNTKDMLRVTPPAFRIDIKEGVDIIEEISRIIGYDNLPLSLPQIKAFNISPATRGDIRTALRETFMAQGFNEIITYAMVNQLSLENTKQGFLKGIRIQNPLTQDQEMMRPSMLPSLLSIVLSNLNKGQKDIKFFEIGKIYTAKGEQEALGLIVTGSGLIDWRRLKKEEVDFYDMKGALEQAFERGGIKDARFMSDAYPFLEKGQSATVVQKNKDIGVIGKIDEKVLNNWDIKQKNVFFAEMDLEVFLNKPPKRQPYKPLVEYPAVVRDVSLAVKKDISFQQVKDVAFEEGSKILTAVKFNEEYLGEKIPSGHRGIVFSLNYQSPARTLREEEVNAVQDKIVQALTNKFGVVVR